MKTSLFGLVLVSAVSVLVGCSAGSNGSGDSSGSENAGTSADSAPFACQSSQDSFGDSIDTCNSYSAMPNDERSQWCTYPGDEVVASCPTSNVWATCTFTDRLGTNVWHWYTDDTIATPEGMKKACDMYSGALVIN